MEDNKYLLDKYKQVKSIQKKLSSLSILLKKNNIDQVTIDNIINDYVHELISPITKHNIKTQYLAELVTIEINKFLKDNTSSQYEVYYNRKLTSENIIADWIILDKTSNKTIVGFNYLKKDSKFSQVKLVLENHKPLHVFYTSKDNEDNITDVSNLYKVLCSEFNKEIVEEYVRPINIVTTNIVEKEKIERINNREDNDIEKEIRKIIQQSILKYEETESIFEKLENNFMTYYNKSCNDMLSLRKRTEKTKGTMFEVFCVMYLEAKGYDEVWMLKDTPKDIIEYLGLTYQDVGIDLIARITRDNKQLYFAIQCKYRSENKDSKGRKIHKVNWKDISTFLSICSRSGPYIKHIIMTNADSVNWKGKKDSKKDYVIARQTFINTGKDIWKKIANINSDGNILGSSSISTTTSSNISTSSISSISTSFISSTTTSSSISTTTSKSNKLNDIDIRELRKKWLDSL